MDIKFSISQIKQIQLTFMSTLPDIFIRSNSQTNPNAKKVGGLFSIKLRSSSFAIQQRGQLNKKTSDYDNRSASTNRYNKRIDGESSHLTSRSDNKSLNKFKNNQDNYSLVEEPRHAILNLNSQIGQSEIQTISNFNIIKRQVIQTCQISNKLLEGSSAQIISIRTQLNIINSNTQANLTQFQEDFASQLRNLEKMYKQLRCLTLQDNKAIKKQVDYIEEDTKIIKQVLCKMENRLNKVLQQFH